MTEEPLKEPHQPGHTSAHWGLGGNHHELAIHPVCHATVPGDAISEILDFESSFKAAGKEAAKGSDKGGERGEDQDVELDWGDGD